MKEKPISSLLAFLYPDHPLKDLEERLWERIRKTKERLTLQDKPFDQSSNLLICYADQLKKGEEAPLQSLRHFLNNHVDGLISGVHLLPFYPYSSDDGFSVIDYTRVNPDAGTWKDVEGLAEDFELMFDGVINHISAKSDWLKAYLEDDPAYADFFIDADPSLDYSMVTRPRALPLLSPFEDHQEKTRHLWTTFSADQVDLNYANPELLLKVIDVLLFYAEKGATYLRLDAIGFMWKELGTNCMHLPQTHAIIKLIRAVMEEAASGLKLITETNVPHHENISYFGDGHDEAQLVYNFSLPPLIAYSILTGDAGIMTNWAQGLELPSRETCFFNFTASHDGVGVRPVEGILSDAQRDVLANAALSHGGRISYRNQPDGSQSPYELNCNYLDLLTAPSAPREERIKRFLLSQAIMLAFPGLPGIYLHSLLGSTNCMDCLEKGHNRSINREKLHVTRLEKELESDPLRKAVFAGYKKLLRARRAHTAFSPVAKFEFLNLHPSLFVIERKADDGSGMLAIHNVSGEKVEINIGRKGKDLLTGRMYDGNFDLDPCSMLWLAF